MSVAHVLKISCNEISSLNDKIHRFWDLDVILAYDKFKNNIASERGRYSVNYPFKVYESRYIAYSATSGSRRETTQ